MGSSLCPQGREGVRQSHGTGGLAAGLCLILRTLDAKESFGQRRDTISICDLKVSQRRFKERTGQMPSGGWILVQVTQLLAREDSIEAQTLDTRHEVVDPRARGYGKPEPVEPGHGPVPLFPASLHSFRLRKKRPGPSAGHWGVSQPLAGPHPDSDFHVLWMWCPGALKCRSRRLGSGGPGETPSRES